MYLPRWWRQISTGEPSANCRPFFELMSKRSGSIKAKARGGDNNILIHVDDRAFDEEGDAFDFMEEVLVHEAAHASLDPSHANDPDWVAAQEGDGNYISTYARDYPNREDIAESFQSYLAVRYRSARISRAYERTILETIPNRIAYFDRLLQVSASNDMHPVTEDLRLPQTSTDVDADEQTFEWPPELVACSQQLHESNDNGGDEWVNLEPYYPNQLSRLSMTSGKETEIIFVNNSTIEVLFYWLDFDHSEKYYGRVAACNSTTQGTFAGHIWLVKDQDGKNLAMFQAEAKTGRAFIGSQTAPDTVDDEQQGSASAQLAKVSGDDQQGPAGAALPEPFLIEVSDQNGNALAGAHVTFAVTSGGGTLSVETAATDSNGRAAATLTLGSQPGTNTVEATVGGLEPVTFTATGLAVARTPQAADPPYHGTVWVDPDIISSSDPTAFQEIAAAGRGERTMFDRRVSGWITVNAYLFIAQFDDGLTAEVQVNPEFGSASAALAEANKYGRVIGRLPTVLRTDVETVWIHKGNHLLGGGNDNILIHVDHAENSKKKGFLEEELVHEGAHTSLDPKHSAALDWISAQKGDGNFISTYARDYPKREDIAESFLSYLAVRYRSARISQSYEQTILKTIPNRIAYFGAQSFDDAMYPVNADLRLPESLAKVSGDDQQGASGAALAEPLVVEVRNQNGTVLEGIQVRFAVASGGGQLSVKTTMTDSSGRAASTLTLGHNPGTNTVETRVAELEPVIFSATGKAIPTTLIKVSGDEQKAPPGAALSEPLVVEVRDQNNNPMEGALVWFAVTARDGNLSTTSDTTDANGRASSTLTLGSEPGTTTVSVRVAELKPVAFIATGQAIPRTLAKVSGEGQQGAPGSSLAEPFVVSVVDQTGTAFAGAPVTFTVTGGDGTLSATTATTDANGRAATTLTLGSQPGTNTVTVSVGGLEPVTFTATAEAASPDGDGETGFSDFFLLADAFGGSDPRFDLDGSGTVDFGDFFLFADHLGQPARRKLLALAREMIGLPEGPQLQQNAPNPFNSETVISWFLLRPGPARLEVYALTGQRVAVLHQGPKKAGAHSVHWDGHDDLGRPLASGVYVYRLVTTEGPQTRKLTLLR